MKEIKKSYLPIEPMSYLDERTDGKQDREIVLIGLLQKTYPYGFAKQFYRIIVNGKVRGYRRIYIDFVNAPYFTYKGDKYLTSLFGKSESNETKT